MSIKLKSYIHSRGLRFSYIADNIGVSSGHLSQILNGRYEPKLSLIKGIAKVLDLDIAEAIKLFEPEDSSTVEAKSP